MIGTSPVERYSKVHPNIDGEWLGAPTAIVEGLHTGTRSRRAGRPRIDQTIEPNRYSLTYQGTTAYSPALGRLDHPTAVDGASTAYRGRWECSTGVAQICYPSPDRHYRALTRSSATRGRRETAADGTTSHSVSYMGAGWQEGGSTKNTREPSTRRSRNSMDGSSTLAEPRPLDGELTDPQGRRGRQQPDAPAPPFIQGMQRCYHHVTCPKPRCELTGGNGHKPAQSAPTPIFQG